MTTEAERRLAEREAALGSAGAGPAGAGPLDAKGLRRLVLGFEKRVAENLEARLKYAEQPEKFMESEVDLDEEVNKLKVLSASAELYPEFIKLNAVPSLLSLIGHENASIAADAMDVIRELTDSDVVEDEIEAAGALAQALVDNNVLELLAERLFQFKEAVPEEATAVFNSLQILENLVEILPAAAGLLGEKTQILPWLLRRVRTGAHDSNRLYASEILSILTTGNGANQDRLLAADGVEALLQSVAPYRKRDPEDPDEEEFLENLFVVLRSLLLEKAACKEAFLSKEGLELMLKLLRKKCFARHSALKVVDFALTRSPEACERFVAALGLKPIFAFFMGKGLSKSDRREETTEAFTERVLAVIATLLKELGRGSGRDRVCAKFVENDGEKVDRLVELYQKYSARVDELDPAEADGDEPEDIYLHRLENGLYALQRVAGVLGALWMTGDPALQQRILSGLHRDEETLGSVADVLAQQEHFLAATEAPEHAQRDGEQLRVLVKCLTVPAES